MQATWKTIVLHLLLVGLFLSVPVLSSPDFDYSPAIFRVKPFLRNFTGYVLVTAFFYVHHYTLFPLLLERRKRLSYFLAVVGSFLVLAALQHAFFTEFVQPARPDFPVPSDIQVRQAPFPDSALMSYASLFIPFTLVWLISVALGLNRRAREAELNRYRTELQNLKYQLQPHFLFNSLNNIYSISIIRPEETPHYILQLSELLRYLLDTEHLQNVLLYDDLQCCRQYCELQRLRHGKSTDDWEIAWPENCGNRHIAPFLLIPLIENAFKYGVHPEKPSPLRIIVSVDKNAVVLETFNKKNVQEAKPLITRGKLGLTKTKERLGLLYPGNYDLHITETDDAYSLTLTLHTRT